MAQEITYEELCAVMYSEEKRWNDTGHMFVAHLDNPTAWFPPFLALMWVCGARVSEVLAVRGCDIKPTTEDGQEVILVTLPNLKQRRNSEKECMFIPAQYPICWEFIRCYISHLENPNGLLFHKSRKTVWAHCHRIWGIGAHRAGRHSWMMAQARRGMSLLDAKQLGGWTSLTSMTPYISKFGRKELAHRMIRLPREGQ